MKKISGCKLANQGWVKNPDLKVKLHDQTELLFNHQNWVGSVNQSSQQSLSSSNSWEACVPVSITRRVHPSEAAKKQRPHYLLTPSSSRCCPNIRTVATLNIMSTNRLLQYFPFNYLKVLIIRAPRQMLTSISHANAKSRKSRPSQSWLN